MRDSVLRWLGGVRPEVRLPVVLVALAILVSGGSTATASTTTSAPGDFSPAEVWTGSCGTCHTVGRGDDVGPDLAGITERRERAWLIQFIQSPVTLLEAGDSTAAELFEEFQPQTMPDQPLTPVQIDRLLTWIETEGPEDPSPPVRAAATATPEELHMGRQLFTGERPFEAGGGACSHCHTLGSGAGAGSLGGDLTDSYRRYQDVELAHLLDGMGTPLMAEIYRDRPLTEEEAFCVRALLARPSPIEPRRGGAWWLVVLSLALTVIGGDGLLRQRDRGDDRGDS